MMDKLYAIKYLKIYFWNEKQFDVSKDFRMAEIDLSYQMEEDLVEHDVQSLYEIKDMTSLSNNQISEINKILNQKALPTVSWDLISENTIVKLKREIKLNKIFKDGQ